LLDDSSEAMSPTSIFAAASTPPDAIADLSLFVAAVAAGIFSAVAGLLVYAVVRLPAPLGTPEHGARGRPPERRDADQRAQDGQRLSAL
jgi:hypothetical protein